MQYYPPRLYVFFYLRLRPGIPASASFRDVPCKLVFDPRHGRATVDMPVIVGQGYCYQ